MSTLNGSEENEWVSPIRIKLTTRNRLNKIRMIEQLKQQKPHVSIDVVINKIITAYEVLDLLQSKNNPELAKILETINDEHQPQGESQ